MRNCDGLKCDNIVLMMKRVVVNDTNSHHAWRPVNLDVSHLRQFHLPPVLFTRLMKNWGVPEIITGELLHSGQNFRGIYKSIKNDIFGLENNLYQHYSHKGVLVRVEETISTLQNWHTCKNFRGTLPCNLSKCAVFHTWYYDFDTISL